MRKWESGRGMGKWRGELTRKLENGGGTDQKIGKVEGEWKNRAGGTDQKMEKWMGN